jgi:hypothetical protein
MGGPEVVFELNDLLDDKEWDKLWLQFCKLYGMPEDSVKNEFGKSVRLGDSSMWSARLPAYYAKTTGRMEWANKAWDDFLRKHRWGRGYLYFDKNLVEGAELLEPVYEVEGVSTNSTAQWCLNAIELLELVGDQIPEDHPLFKEGSE